jgi:hypothetical protein
MSGGVLEETDKLWEKCAPELRDKVLALRQAVEALRSAGVTCAAFTCVPCPRGDGVMVPGLGAWVSHDVNERVDESWVQQTGGKPLPVPPLMILAMEICGIEPVLDDDPGPAGPRPGLH